jgi:hypothetical protein
LSSGASQVSQAAKANSFRPLCVLQEEEGMDRAKGEVEQDEEALRTMQTLGQNLAWLPKKINA